jgi:hypothetical protein
MHSEIPLDGKGWNRNTGLHLFDAYFPAGVEWASRIF